MAERIGTIKEIRNKNVDPLISGLTSKDADSVFGTTPFIDGVTRSAKETAGTDPVFESPSTESTGASFEDIAPVFAAGMSSIGNAPATTSSGEATASAIKSGLGGAITGGLAGSKIGAIGGPMGAAVGGVLGLALGGVDAFFKVKNSRKQARAAKKLNDAARKANEKALSEARKWQRINRMDSLQQARRSLAQQKAQNRWQNYNNAKGRMTSILNSNTALANNFRKMLKEA